MAEKRSITGRAVFIVFFSLVLFALTLTTSYFTSSKINDFYFNQQSDKITKWKFVTGQSMDEIKKENAAWKYSNDVFGIKKPLLDKYIRISTTLSQNKDGEVLLLSSQSESIQVYLDGVELKGEVTGNRYTRTTTEVITLPASYDGKELEITARASLLFEIKAGITQLARIKTINEEVSHGIITLGLIVTIFGFLLFLIFLLLSIKLRGIGRIILSGILLIGTGATIILAEILPFITASNDLLNYKIQFVSIIILLPLLFGITLYTSKRKGIAPKIMIFLLSASLIPFAVFTNDKYIQAFMTGYAVLVIITSFLFLFFVKSLLEENVFKKKFLYFALFFSGLCGAYDFFNVSFGISPGIIGFFMFAFMLFFVALTNITIARAIHMNVRIFERNNQVKKNTMWIERVVSACTNIFAKQKLEGYCVQAAISIKDFILNDIAENADVSDSELNKRKENISVSVAMKKDGSFEEIYNQGSIKDCKYELLAHRYSSNKGEGVFFAGSYLVILLFESHELKSIIYFEGLHHGVSENLKNIVRIAYNNISIAFDNLKLKSDIVQTQQLVFIYLAEMSEAKSAETGSHIKRVSEYVRALCESLKMNPHEVEIVTKASMMHDIGKLAIPEEIIMKSGDLSASEYEIIKQHITYGHSMLSKSTGDFMEAAAVIAHQHHERWNGDGYLGLKGAQIHIYARIVAVADVFDALIRKRSYKEAWTPDEAMGYLLEKAGSHFDPDITEAFARSFDRIIAIKNEFSD